ncbi:MAG: hypothetical protein K9W44_03415 [Candidatus Lokiarchaeota archaeon]|nr:hypothetical protein [Candidatus Harpocratesius repetitus]
MQNLTQIPLTSEEKVLIGWKYVIDQLNPETPYGRTKKSNLGLFCRSDLVFLNKELDNLALMIENRKQYPKIHIEIGYELTKLKDIRPILHKLTQNRSLDEVDFYELKYTLLISSQIQKLYSHLNIAIKGIIFPDLNKILDILDPQHNRMPTFYYYPEYSETLQSFQENRKKIEEEIYKITRTLNVFITNPESVKDSQISHHSLTTRSLDEKILLENKLNDLKLQRSSIIQQEQLEKKLIRKKLTEKIQPFLEKIWNLINSIEYLDWLRSKSKLAEQFKGIRPNIHEKHTLSFTQMRNPYIEMLLSQRSKEFTPISVHFSQGVNLITGANMGGKTVLLYTTLLNIILAHCGLFVFAESAQIPIGSFFGTIFSDAQDIQQGLSSFGAEIVKFNSFLSTHEKTPGFLFMDEFARGTNPSEGRIIFKSVTHYLQNVPWISILTTHYDIDIELNENIAYFQVIGLRNTNLEELSQELLKIRGNALRSVALIQDHMDYRIERIMGRSKIPTDAINIARILGLNPEIIRFAKQLMKNEY